MTEARRSTALVAGGLIALCALVYGPYVANGGFFWDDWQLAARDRFPPIDDPNYSGSLDLVLLAYRPGTALVLPTVHALLGPDPGAHIALGLAINVLTSLCFFWFLRALRMETLPAALAAALMLVFPWSDAMRLWPTAAINNLGVIWYLLGVVASLAGLRSNGRRAWLLGALGVLLYVWSVLTYEVTGALALLTVVLYWREAGLRRALRRWAFDAVAIVAALVWVGTKHTRETQSLEEMVRHAGEIAEQAVTLLALSVEPFGSPPALPILAAVAFLAADALLVRRRLPPDHPAREPLGRWLVVGGCAAVAAVAAYVPLIPADEHYEPLAPGVNNRINLLAAPAYAVYVVSVAMLLGTLVFVRRPERLRRGSAAVAIAVVAAIGFGYALDTVQHRRDWEDGARVQDRVLAAVEQGLPRDPPRGTTVYTFGVPTYVADGIPSFSVSWDLKAALRLRYDRRDVRGFAIPLDGLIACRTWGVEPLGFSYDRAEGARYGRAFFVDVPTGRGARIDGVGECRRERARMSAVYG